MLLLEILFNNIVKQQLLPLIKQTTLEYRFLFINVKLAVLFIIIHYHFNLI